MNTLLLILSNLFEFTLKSICDVKYKIIKNNLVQVYIGTNKVLFVYILQQTRKGFILLYQI